MRRVLFMMVVGFILFTSIVAVHFSRTIDDKLHIVICDVGQGDALVIRTPGRQEVLIDGGPDRKVLQCLDENLPFWDRTLSLVLLTHPHYDHFRGLIDVLERYSVQMIGREALTHDSSAFEVYRKAVASEGATVHTMQQGTTVRFADGVSISILGPDAEFLKQENPDGLTGNDNPPSLIIHITYGTFDFLHTGDSDGEDLIRFLPVKFQPEVFTLAHHGSEHGYTEESSKVLSAPIGVISAGRGNSYGHPHAEVLELLQQKNTTVFRTDIHGNIELVVDKTGRVDIETDR